MPDKKVVLIVEDEAHIASLIETNLQLEGFETAICSSAQDAVEFVKSQSVDILLLDVMLPDGSGIDACRRVKMIRSNLPVLMLSALGQSSDRIKGLKAGADDYLPKPFELEELLLRVHNLTGRYAADSPDIVQLVKLGAATINFDDLTITRDHEVHRLTSNSGLLLKYIVEHRGEVISRQSIMNEVWGLDRYPNSRTIDNLITTFRKYIEEIPSAPAIITTVRGIGYRIN